ncbi:MAG: hypothetical protein D6732_23705 [Methanobacteriota archaeon]|nr:MAG: hypothetical protein D6732_23705 [Euryarchaeota archaeon]
MFKKKKLWLWLSALIWGSAYIALFAYHLYQACLLREILAMVMICGFLGYFMVIYFYYHAGKKIKIGFPSFFKLLGITPIIYFMVKDTYPLLSDSLLFFVLIIVFILILIISASVKFEE